MYSTPFFIMVFIVGCLVALGLHIYLFSPISTPQILQVPSLSLAKSYVPPNAHLQEVTKIGEGILKKPEDVCLDKDGTLYTASRDGWIKRLHKNGSSLENWKWVNSTTLLGMATLASGGLVICDTEMGLLKVDEDGVTTLVSHFNGSKLWFADDVIEGKDGSLYFSIASTKFGLHNWHLDLLEAKPHGQILKFNPQTKETTLLLDNLFFANGVAISKDHDYLLVCETWKFRCLKYWLQGDLQGNIEVFIDNLPGAPDNINLAPDGSFWIALLQLTNKGFEFVHTSKIIKHLVATFPGMMNFVQGTHNKATVIKVSEDGNILKRFDDPEGKVMNFVTSAVEYDGNLYLGSLNSNFVDHVTLGVLKCLDKDKDKEREALQFRNLEHLTLDLRDRTSVDDELSWNPTDSVPAGVLNRVKGIKIRLSKISNENEDCLLNLTKSLLMRAPNLEELTFVVSFEAREWKKAEGIMETKFYLDVVKCAHTCSQCLIYFYGKYIHVSADVIKVRRADGERRTCDSGSLLQEEWKDMC